MRIFRLPKTSRWIIVCAFVLFVLIAAYRFVIYFLFKDLFTGAMPSVPASFLLGFAFDARIMAAPVALIFLLSFWPGLHYFRTKTGKKIAIALFALALAVIHLFYMADITHLRCFGQRLNAAIISDLAKNTPRGNLFESKFEWMVVVSTMAVLEWVFILIMVKTHKFISKARGTDSCPVRIFWHAFIFIACAFFMYGGFRLKPISIETASKNHNPASLQMAVTPFETLVSSLPKKH